MDVTDRIRPSLIHQRRGAPRVFLAQNRAPELTSSLGMGILDAADVGMGAGLQC